MGLLDRFAARVAAEIVKAPNLPAGAVTMTEEEMAGGWQRQYGSSATPLDRNPLTANVPFAPGFPLFPGPINPTNPRTGRAEPRRYEYQVAQNINVTETRPVPFKTLRAAADQIDIIRRCIEVTKAKMAGLNWDIVLSQDATEKIAAESGKDYVRAMAEARVKFTGEIDRLRRFWENPDRANGMTWVDWLNMSVEEILVIDAWSIWPQRALNNDLYGFQILDGTTIKPLLDDRGMRPLPPQVAFQQILYGFPRSEFMANDDDPQADGEFTSDDLAYLVRNRRTMSVYGFSPTERALPLADLYLRRQQWIRAEYTDGVVPDLLFKTDINWGTNPELLRQYENILNDDLAGQTEQRVRARLLPAGLDPFQPEGYAEKFQTTLDDYLIASICGHFGVQPTEIGYNPKAGLGGAGFETGKAENAEMLGALPLTQWLSLMITNLSYTYLGMPRELEFRLMPPKRTDTEEMARKAQIEVTSAQKSINERRSELGLPLLDTPQADMPILVAGGGAYFLSPDGLINAATAAVAPTLDEDLEEQTPANQPLPEEPEEEEGSEESFEEEAEEQGENEDKEDDEEALSREERAEAKAYMKWVMKGARHRRFEFHRIDPIVAEALNRCAFEGDIDTARALVKAYLS